MSRGDRFDRGDFQSRYSGNGAGAVAPPSPPSAVTPVPVWPVTSPRVGQSVLADRNGKGRPHKGVDLFVPGGSPVRAARSGKVLRVVDGRVSSETGKRRAGLFVDVRSNDGLIYRYLHLGSVAVAAGDSVKAGRSLIGTVAPEGTSGSGAEAHLHLEIRKSDWNGSDYGDPIDPLTILKKK